MLQEGLTVSLIGLAVVFSALALFIALIVAVRFFARPKQSEKTVEEVMAPAIIQSDDEIAAVIAAITMMLGENRRVVSIIPRGTAKAPWRAAARQLTMDN